MVASFRSEENNRIRVSYKIDEDSYLRIKTNQETKLKRLARMRNIERISDIVPDRRTVFNTIPGTSVRHLDSNLKSRNCKLMQPTVE